MTTRVLTTPGADEQAERIADWWREHRAAAPTLMADELAGALDLLENVPDVGRRYRLAKVPGLRRLLLPRSRHHIYYVHDAAAQAVVVLAIWVVSRRSSPRLSIGR